MSATLIGITCAAIVLSLGVWLAAIAIACRNSSRGNPRIDPGRGRVLCGTRDGGGQPVASRQDGEIVPAGHPGKSAVLLTKRYSSPAGL